MRTMANVDRSSYRRVEDQDRNGGYFKWHLNPSQRGPPAHPDRRDDLQGVRGWAVLAVLVFHFVPPLLPYGFLGVDAFFVLSGFLITLVLSRDDPLSPSSYLSFYARRIKRIFPLYLLVVTFCLLLVVILYENSELLFYNTRSALRALTFATNLKGENREEEYFRQVVSSHDLFTHTWSLAVEVQFYLIAPILLLPGKVFFTYRSMVPYLAVIGLISFVYHAVSSENVSFNSVFSRIWQFMVGAIAFQVHTATKAMPVKPEDEKRPCCGVMCSTGTILISSLAGISFWVFILIDKTFALRIFVTLFTGFLIVNDRGSVLLSNRLMVYFGDISYALYLVHWPIFSLLMHYEIYITTEIVLTMMTTICLSVLVHELYEVHYLRMEMSHILLIIGSFYLTSAVILFTTPGTVLTRQPLSTKFDVMTLNGDLWEEENTRNITIGEAIKINEEYERDWYNNLRYPNCTFIEGPGAPFGLTECAKGDGKYDFLVMGNSYTANLGRLVQRHFKKYYRNFTMYAVDSCEALMDTPFHTSCKHRVFYEILERVKPQILFIIQRFLEPGRALIPGPVDKDPVYLEIMKDLQLYAPKVKKIFILNALPKPARFLGEKFKKYKNGSLPVNEDDVNKSGVEEEPWAMRARIAEVAKNCSNCVVYDFYRRHLMPDNKTFMVIHPHTKIQLFERALHYTPYGLRLIEPVYQMLSAHFEEFLEAKYPYNVLE